MKDYLKSNNKHRKTKKKKIRQMFSMVNISKKIKEMKIK